MIESGSVLRDCFSVGVDIARDFTTGVGRRGIQRNLTHICESSGTRPALFVTIGAIPINKDWLLVTNKPTIVVLQGDQTGQELLVEGLRVLAPEVTRVDAAF